MEEMALYRLLVSDDRSVMY